MGSVLGIAGNAWRANDHRRMLWMSVVVIGYCECVHDLGWCRVGVRDERRAERDRVVLAAAGELFRSRGYVATTVPQIAERAGVAVGTVAKVGSKDALFLRSWEEGSTKISLRLIADAAGASGSVKGRVWAYLGPMIESTIAMPEAMRDYFVAYLRAAEHEANLGRLGSVLDALRGLFRTDEQGEDSAARLAVWTIWLAYSGLAYGLASKTYTGDDARRLMEAIVAAQCAPFESEETK
jgi:AcrR family transcriptional regulator